MLRISYEVEFRFPDGLSEKAKDLISKMLTRRPADRISALNALNHGWVRVALLCRGPGARDGSDPESRIAIPNFLSFDLATFPVLEFLSRVLSSTLPTEIIYSSRMSWN